MRPWCASLAMVVVAFANDARADIYDREAPESLWAQVAFDRGLALLHEVTADTVPHYTGPSKRVSEWYHEVVVPWSNANGRKLDEARAFFELSIVESDEVVGIAVSDQVQAFAALGAAWNELGLQRFRAIYQVTSRRPGAMKYFEEGAPGCKGAACIEAAVFKSNQPWRERARAPLARCTEISTANQYWDENSERCEAFLGRYFRWEFHPMEEFHPTVMPSVVPRFAPVDIDAR